MKSHIFREYDIRGIVGAELDGAVGEAVGRAFGSELRERNGGRSDLRLVIGSDNRPSSPALTAAVIGGLRAAGVNVIDVGTVPTPVLYYAAETLPADAGIQITGSHNPPEYNGIKMLMAGRPVYGAAIQGLRERIEAGRFTAGSGQLEHRAIIDTYSADLAARFRLRRPIRLVVDCGNGAGSLVAVELLRRIGADVIPLYCESDGTFPNHHPDPTVDAFIQDLIARVRLEGADLGIAFDGDADRLGAVDERGQVVRGDILLLLFALDTMARRGRPQKLVFDVKCSQAVPEVFEAAGGEAIMWKTGHSLIKEKMREVGAPIAGELSGHICYGDGYFGFDDALYGACYLVELCSRLDGTLGERVREFPQYVATPELRLAVTEASKFEIVARAVSHFRRRYPVVDVDGVRVLFDGGWGLLRASNTQPVLVARFEARTAERLAEIQQVMTEWLAGEGVSLEESGHH